IAGVQLANIDMLTQMLQHTLSQRQACVPAAMAIIAQHQQWFYNWLHTYRQAPAIRYLKAQLKKLIDLRGTAANEAAYNHQQLINTTVEALMLNIRRQGTPGCHIITAYAHFLTQPIFTHP
ncbi:MAG TPA: hypothetical protein PKD90_12965, partial [Phnomibacter sp.]|nr:hypothetical protein [Phnomibacter sp.]